MTTLTNDSASVATATVATLAAGSVATAWVLRRLYRRHMVKGATTTPPGLKVLERVAKLSPRVLRVLGHNPGSFSLQGTNMYIVGQGASRILIDAGQGKADDLPALLRAMANDGAERLSDVLITHYHHDHTEGIKDLRAHFGNELRVWKLPWAPGILVPWQKVCACTCDVCILHVCNLF